MTARVGGLAALIGVALVAGHAALVPSWVAATSRPALFVDDAPPLVAEVAPIPRPAAGAEVHQDGAGPGLVVTRWQARYRGGVTRTIAAPTLVGPFQDVATPPCAGRLAVGQRLLDDGDGTIAPIVRRELTAALADLDVVGLGRFRRLETLALRWVGLRDHPFDRAMFPAAALRAPQPGGYLRAKATVVFERAKLVVILGAVPRTDGGTLGFTIGLAVHVDVDNRALQWIADRIGVDRLATKFARGQLDTALLAALAPPPPLPLPGGGELIIEPCPDRPVEVVADRYAALALRWRLTAPVATEDGVAIRPPRRGPVALPPPRPEAAITFDLDLDGLNGLLYQLWRTGYLDRELDRLDLAGRFNRHPVVASFLTLRLSPVRLALPPVVAPAPPDRLRLDLVTALAIADGAGAPTEALALAGVALGLTGTAGITTEVALAGLELTCRPAPGRLAPCYGDVVDTVRAESGEAPAALGAALSTALTELFVGQRLVTDQAPAELAIVGARAATVAAGAGVRLELDARIAPSR